MDFNFLFTYYTCVSSVEDLNKQKGLYNSNSLPVIPIQYNNTSEAAAVLFSVLSDNNHPAFNILITPGPADAINKKWLSQIVSIISHSAYNKSQEKQVVFFGEGEWRDVINEFLQEIRRLGFKNTIAVHLGKDIAPNNEALNFIFLRSMSDETRLIEAASTAMLSLSQPFQIVFHSSLDKSVPAIKEKLHNYVMLHYKEDALQLLMKIFALNRQISGLQDTVLNKESLLISKQAYLDFLLNQYPSDDNTARLNEELKIRKFYHYEYEVLPTWYKQVGHIIKVIIGKRTFKSLFNDNVKKYKD